MPPSPVGRGGIQKDKFEFKPKTPTSGVMKRRPSSGDMKATLTKPQATLALNPSPPLTPTPTLTLTPTLP